MEELLKRIVFLEKDFHELKYQIDKLNGKHRKSYLKSKKALDKFFDSLPGMDMK